MLRWGGEGPAAGEKPAQVTGTAREPAGYSGACRQDEGVVVAYRGWRYAEEIVLWGSDPTQSPR